MNLVKKILCLIIIMIIVISFKTSIVKAKTVEITTETLNLRKEASTDSNIVALISVGDECEVLGEEGDWYKVQYKEYTGYISKEYTKVVDSDEETTNNTQSTENNDENTIQENTNSIENDNSDDKTQESDTTSQQESNTSLKEGIINKKTEVRIVPLIYSNGIETLEKNSKVSIITEINDWIYVQTDTISGWIRKESVEIQEVSNTNNKNDSNNDKTEDNQTENEQNSANTDEKKENNESAFEEKTMYSTDYINIRKEPNTSSEIIMTVTQNTALKVIGEEDEWYKVSTSAGEAYVSKELLSDKKVTVTNRGDIDRTESISNNEKNTSTVSKEESTNSISTNEIVSYAKKFLGVPYVYGGASSSGFDCSGFTMYVYNHFGISMAHGAQSQSKLGTEIKANKSSKSSLLNNLKEGDLVFFLDYETMDEIGHCGIYIGDGNFIHASSGSGYCVKINSLLPGEYYNTRYCAARRIV